MTDQEWPTLLQSLPEPHPCAGGVSAAGILSRSGQWGSIPRRRKPAAYPPRRSGNDAALSRLRLNRSQCPTPSANSIAQENQP